MTNKNFLLLSILTFFSATIWAGQARNSKARALKPIIDLPQDYKNAYDVLQKRLASKDFVWFTPILGNEQRDKQLLTKNYFAVAQFPLGNRNLYKGTSWHWRQKKAQEHIMADEYIVTIKQMYTRENKKGAQKPNGKIWIFSIESNGKKTYAVWNEKGIDTGDTPKKKSSTLRKTSNTPLEPVSSMSSDQLLALLDHDAALPHDMTSYLAAIETGQTFLGTLADLRFLQDFDPLVMQNIANNEAADFFSVQK